MFRWSENYSIGHQQLDAQHQMLFELISTLETHLPRNQLMNIPVWNHGIEGTLRHLVEYANYHFETEEMFLLQQSYGSLQDHCRCHFEYTQSVNRMIGQITETRSLEHLDVLIRYLKSWWLSHVLTEDQDIKKMLLEPQVT